MYGSRIRRALPDHSEATYL